MITTTIIPKNFPAATSAWEISWDTDEGVYEAGALPDEPIVMKGVPEYGRFGVRAILGQYVLPPKTIWFGYYTLADSKTYEADYATKKLRIVGEVPESPLRRFIVPVLAVAILSGILIAASRKEFRK